MIICMGCMRELNRPSRFCPYCGYDSSQGPGMPYFLEPGTILKNRYIVGKSIGNGGFGITYIGYDIVLNRRCAIKEYFPRDLSQRPKGTLRVQSFGGSGAEQFRLGLDSFLTEAKKLAEFTYIPQIVDVYDCIQANGTGYIIMEYISGSTIGQILKKQGRYSYEEARDLMIEVLKGLVRVHKGNVIHRDIAPDNIMLTPGGQVKLIDFGAARQVIADRSMNYSVILKPGYAPVEQYSATGRQGPWTDVYAVGATFYRMITGKKPPVSLDRLQNDELKAPSQCGEDIPRYADQLILGAMEIRPEDRIQSAEEFLTALVEEKTVHIRREEGITPLDVMKYAVSFLGIMIFTAFLVCFGLELAVNGNNMVYEIMGSRSGQETGENDTGEDGAGEDDTGEDAIGAEIIISTRQTEGEEDGRDV